MANLGGLLVALVGRVIEAWRFHAPRTTSHDRILLQNTKMPLTTSSRSSCRVLEVGDVQNMSKVMK